ncbi:MAG TPA: lysophospholipase [bacterium]|nr:lysophospholipase [bacterium]
MVEQQPEVRMVRGQFTTWDGLRLYHRWWESGEEVRAVMVVVHGIGEHSGWYESTAERLVPLGLRVETFDLRGHGRSGGERALVRSFDEYLNDLEVFLGAVRERNADLPFLLFGHSMGGVISALYVIDRQPDLQGLLLSAPAIDISGAAPAVLVSLGKFIGRLFPRLPTVTIASANVFRDPEMANRYDADPLVYHRGIKARTGAELNAAGQRIREHAGDIRIPLLIMQGTEDQLTEFTASRELYEHAGSEDKTFHSYDGWRHDLLHDPEKERVLGDLSRWIQAHL